MKVAILILNWQDAPSTRRLVDNLIRNGHIPEQQIYIIDNASNDDSFEKLSSWHKNCNVIRNHVNSGYTGGNNFGLKNIFQQNYDAALVLNNDVDIKIEQSFSQECQRLLTEAPDSVIGLSVVNPISLQTAYPTRPGFILAKILDACLPIHFAREEFPIICGCAMVISRSAFLKQGGLEEEYFMYCEELEYCIRTIKMNGKILTLPKDVALVYREEGHSTRKPYVYYYQTRNMLALLKKHSAKATPFTWLIALLLLFAAARTKNAHKLSSSIQGLIDAIRGVTGYNRKMHLQ